ncbi:MAG: hypothetical protein LBR36_04620 [Bacteroidales bacterium]|jgi:hypothetical protein|nr:hypothetical protein [Bacteroidales bacterium]
MNRLEKWLIFWTLFIGIGALWGTFMMWYDPSGELFGLSAVLPYLQALPFADFFFKDFKWSGLALLLVNGISQLLAALLLIRRHKFAPVATLACGLLLIFWIIAQFVIFPLNILSIVYFIFGVTEFVLAWRLIVSRRKNKQNQPHPHDDMFNQLK